MGYLREKFHATTECRNMGHGAFHGCPRTHSRIESWEQASHSSNRVVRRGCLHHARNHCEREPLALGLGRKYLDSPLRNFRMALADKG